MNEDTPMTDPEFEQFDDIIGLLRQGPIDSEADRPPASLWAGIEAEISAGSTPGAVDVAPVVSLDQARSRRRGWGKPAAITTLVAAVVLLIGVPLGLALSGDDDPVVVASADLEPVGDQPAGNSTVELLDDNGEYALAVDTGMSAGGGEFLELWLLAINDAGELDDLVSLGKLDGSGRYEVPEGVDLARFDVVDVSVELDDGNPDHSGNSIVRGELV